MASRGGCGAGRPLQQHQRRAKGDNCTGVGASQVPSSNRNWSNRDVFADVAHNFDEEDEEANPDTPSEPSLLLSEHSELVSLPDEPPSHFSGSRCRQHRRDSDEVPEAAALARAVSTVEALRAEQSAAAARALALAQGCVIPSGSS